MNLQETWTIGIDLGGTKVKAALVSGAGEIGRRIKRRTDTAGGPKAIEQQIFAMVEELLEKQPGSAPFGIGVGVAGQIDAEDGSVRRAPNLHWQNVPLQSHLEDQLDLPVTVLNDVRAATWGEWLHGTGNGCDDLICLFVGTGVGGGVVSGGQMLTGTTNTAGELGHITVDLHGPACSCRNRGCLEALAGGWAIARRAQEGIASDPVAGQILLKIAGDNIGDVTARTVSQAFRKRDRLACQIVENVSHSLGAGVVALVNMFNPQRIILGGGVIKGLPELIERVKDYVDQHALRAATDQLEIIPAKLQGDAGVVGAAALVHRLVARHGAGSCVLA